MTIDLVDAWIGRMAGRGVRHRSITTWLESAHRFGRVLGADTDVLGYIRRKADAHDRRARRQRSRKEERYMALEIGIGDVFARARELHERAETGPEHLVSTRRDRLEAALIALSVASPLRCGDLHSLRIGVDIERRAGSWSIDTVQAKTKQPYHVPELWSAVGAILDALILDGRPPDQLRARLDARHGTALFSWADEGNTPVHPGWPSDIWRRHFGVGVHMVRTMWGSYYVDHEPARAWAATAMLGHASAASRNAYEIRARRAQAVSAVQGLIAEIVDQQGSRRRSAH
jgi:integrase